VRRVTTWSCTPFFGETDVLEIRLATLDAVVTAMCSSRRA